MQIYCWKQCEVPITTSAILLLLPCIVWVLINEDVDASADDDQRNNVHVLVTGFEIFGSHAINPSWEVVFICN